jgi:uncharacterized protein YsxB (DUF464 family)
MTTIKINKDNISIRGHSKDIVCSSISTAVYFLIHISNCKYKIDKGMVTEITTTDSKTLTVFKDYIKELSLQYPKNLEVLYEV